jgi:hypothetical protein
MLPLFTTITISHFSLRRRSITCSSEVEVGTQSGCLAIERRGASIWNKKNKGAQTYNRKPNKGAQNHRKILGREKHQI